MRSGWLLFRRLRIQIETTRIYKSCRYTIIKTLCRVYRLLSGNVPLDVSIKRSLRFEGDTRFVSYWIPSPWGVILFYGMFLRVSDRSVVSRSASLFSQDADAKPRVEAMCAQAHREYRDFITETHAIPTSLDGPETN
jgi:hypothetical protein